MLVGSRSEKSGNFLKPCDPPELFSKEFLSKNSYLIPLEKLFSTPGIVLTFVNVLYPLRMADRLGMLSILLCSKSVMIVLYRELVTGQHLVLIKNGC